MGKELPTTEYLFLMTICGHYMSRIYSRISIVNTKVCVGVGGGMAGRNDYHE